MRGIDLTGLSRSEREAVHWRLFAGELAGELAVNLDARREELDDEQFLLTKPTESARESRAQRRIGEARARLTKAAAHQARIRRLLLLEGDLPPDEVSDG